MSYYPTLTTFGEKYVKKPTILLKFSRIFTVSLWNHAHSTRLIKPVILHYFSLKTVQYITSYNCFTVLLSLEESICCFFTYVSYCMCVLACSLPQSWFLFLLLPVSRVKERKKERKKRNLSFLPLVFLLPSLLPSFLPCVLTPTNQVTNQVTKDQRWIECQSTVQITRLFLPTCLFNCLKPWSVFLSVCLCLLNKQPTKQTTKVQVQPTKQASCVMFHGWTHNNMTNMSILLHRHHIL